MMIALHGSATRDATAREQALLLPNREGEQQPKRENIQWTLAILRPELFATKKSAVLQKIAALGFKIIMQKETQMTKKQATKFYKEKKKVAYYKLLVDTMSSGPFLVLTLSKNEAIKAWKEALGPSNIDEALEKAPQSLRAQFPGTSSLNQIHGSDSEETAKSEIAYFFPMEQTLAVIKPRAMDCKDEIIAAITKAGFKIAASKETTIRRKDAEVLYEDKKESPFFEELINSMTSGPALFMALSRQGAVSGWRVEMGDVDPEVAKATSPNSLRAQFGTSILHNAVHGSSNEARAKVGIYTTCGYIVFNEDGTIKEYEQLSREDRERTLLWQMSEEELVDIILARERANRRHSYRLRIVYCVTVMFVLAAYRLTLLSDPPTHFDIILFLLKIICDILCIVNLPLH